MIHVFERQHLPKRGTSEWQAAQGHKSRNSAFLSLTHVRASFGPDVGSRMCERVVLLPLVSSSLLSFTPYCPGLNWTELAFILTCSAPNRFHRLAFAFTLLHFCLIFLLLLLLVLVYVILCVPIRKLVSDWLQSFRYLARNFQLTSVDTIANCS